MTDDIYTASLPLLTHKGSVNLPENKHLRADLVPKQTSATAWLYRVKRGLLSDPVGSGKTITTLSLLTLLKSRGEPYRAIVMVMNYASQLQWMLEIKDKTDLNAVFVDGEPNQRKKLYASSGWEVAVVRYSTLLRDVQILRALNVDVLVLDEPSAPFVGAHHPHTRTSTKLRSLAERLPRVVLLDATPMQSSPFIDLHSLFAIFVPNVFPKLEEFDRHYIEREYVEVKRGGRSIIDSKIVRYKNVKQFKSIIKPYIMRRTDSTGMPDIVSKMEWLTLSDIQRKYYRDVLQGIVRIFDESIPQGADAETVNRRSHRIRAHWHHLQYACDTTMAFDDPNPSSVKLDWLVRMLKYGIDGKDKVVVFSRFKIAIQHILQRLSEEGIQACRLTGDDSKEEQGAAYNAFRDPDSGIRVMVGTSTLERALNLQVARYLIPFNQIYNPSRMEQLAGRVRRRFSEHDTIFVINLLTENTIESKLYSKMQQLAAVPDYIFNEKSDLFAGISEQEIRALLQD